MGNGSSFDDWLADEQQRAVAPSRVGRGPWWCLDPDRHAWYDVVATPRAIVAMTFRCVDRFDDDAVVCGLVLLDATGGANRIRLVPPPVAPPTWDVDAAVRAYAAFLRGVHGIAPAVIEFVCDRVWTSASQSRHA